MTRFSIGNCLVAVAACCACASVRTQDDSTSTDVHATGGSSGMGELDPSGGASSMGPSAVPNGGATGAGGAMPTTGVAGWGGTTTTGGVPGAGGASTVTTGGSPGAGAIAGTGGADAGTTGGTGGATINGGDGGRGDGDPCAGGTTGPSSDVPGSKAQVRGYGGVQLTTSTQTRITSLETTLTVPEKPSPGGTLFLWPGLEPLTGSANYDPIGTGVLQPVLTWGGTCAPHAPNDYVDWWISGQYVNTLGNASGFTGCKGGDGMTVKVGDALHMVMSLNGTVWNQSVTDEANGKTVSFDFDLRGQAQNWIIFSIEAPTGKQPVSDVVFTSTVITTADADGRSCAPTLRGTNDYFSAPRASQDGRRCCIDKIILRGRGVPPSGPN